VPLAGRASVALWAALLLTDCAATVRPIPRTEIQVWTGSDDALSGELIKAFEEGLLRSGQFSIVRGVPRFGLMAVLPRAIEWRDVKNRQRISFRLEFATGSEPYSATRFDFVEGECWRGQMERCASTAVAGALRAARGHR